MKLTELAGLTPDLEVEREGTFEDLGTITHRRPAMLGYIEAEKFLKALTSNDGFACVITTRELAQRLPQHLGVAVSADPRRAFFTAHNRLAQGDFYGAKFDSTVDPTASIDPSAHIASEGVVVGPRARIGPHAVILEGSRLGTDVSIGPGTVIGGAGFEFKRLGQEILAVKHAGGVLIGDRVEIQANSAVDRAIYGGSTEIGDDTKIDNLVHVAHYAVIRRRCLIAASAMIAGSATIGDDVWIGPAAVISSEVAIGDGASVTIGSVVISPVASGDRVTGHFAFEHRSFMRQWLQASRR